MSERRSVRSVVADYVAISKPRIVLLLLVVAWAAMFLASSGFPDLRLFWAVTLAGVCSTAASGAFNNVVERDRDARMGRTADRPLAAGRIRVRSAVAYGLGMAALGTLSLLVVGAWLASALLVAAIVYYVFVYTVWLKPATALNIVIGGFAGSFPALIGWAAVTGNLGLGAWILALIVFLWTPAHFWALALLYQEDYRAAAFPMYPVVHGEILTRRQIVAYSALTVAASLVLVAIGGVGVLYLAAAVALGAVLVGRSLRLMRHHQPAAYRSFFLFTIQYLGLLLVALMVDQVVPQRVLLGG